MLCLQAIKRMQQEPTEAELMIVRSLPIFSAMCFAVTNAHHETKPALAMPSKQMIQSALGSISIVSHKLLQLCFVEACVLGLAQEAIEILGNDTAGDEARKGALQARTNDQKIALSVSMTISLTEL